MSNDLPWWDSKWNEPDPRISTLKNKIQDFEADNLPSRIETLETQMQKLLLHDRLLTGILLKKITQDEVFTILIMLESVDPADINLANDLIEKKLPSP